jgi:hypothetical protein
MSFNVKNFLIGVACLCVANGITGMFLSGPVVYAFSILYGALAAYYIPFLTVNSGKS